MQRADAEAKFDRNTRAMLKSGQMRRIADAVWNLDRANSAAALLESLVIAA
jgi:hypothetical protein